MVVSGSVVQFESLEKKAGNEKPFKKLKMLREQRD